MENAIVLAMASPPWEYPISHAHMVAAPIRKPWNKIFPANGKERIPSFGSLGGWFKRSRSAGSIPMAMAGRESVSRLINSRCTGAKGNGSALIDVYSTQRIPAIFPDNKNWMEFLIFRYTFLPFATALIIVAKLSSVKIMAAASLETSVPAFPIAIPMSAFFKAGASFTPSPVIAVMCPFFCHASTMRILCSGDTLAYTEIFSSLSCSC